MFPLAVSFAWNPERYDSGEILRTVNDDLGGSSLMQIAIKIIG